MAITRCWRTATTPASRWPGCCGPGSARSNTAADHLTILEAAIAALPPGFRRRLMVTADGAGASHELITRLDKLATRPGCQLTYSVGWELGKRERAAIAQVPGQAWQIAINARGEIRERRADDACDDDTCGHRACWIEEAHVTELTGLLRKGPGGDRLAAWPASMRVFARRERPHPGAQLTLFEIEDGYRYTLWVTNLPEATRGWRGNQAYIDAAHRVHARVEDGIRTGKDTGIGRFPSEAMAMNKAWLAAALIAATLLTWLRLLALDGKLARAEPKTLRYKVLHGGRAAHPRRPAPAAENPGQLALGRRHHQSLGTHLRPGQRPLTSTDPALSRRSRKDPTPRGPWNPRPPGPAAGLLSYPDPKIKITSAGQRPREACGRRARCRKMSRMNDRG